MTFGWFRKEVHGERWLPYTEMKGRWMHVYVRLSCIAVHLKLPQCYLLWKWQSLSCVRLFATSWTIQSMEFSRPESWSGNLSLLQGIFPTQGSNPGLPHFRQILYQLSHKGSPLSVIPQYKNKTFKVLRGEKGIRKFRCCWIRYNEEKMGPRPLNKCSSFFSTFLRRTRWWVSSEGPPLGIDWWPCFPGETMIGKVPIMCVSVSCPRDPFPRPVESVDPPAVYVLIYLGVQTCSFNL